MKSKLLFIGMVAVIVLACGSVFKIYYNQKSNSPAALNKVTNGCDLYQIKNNKVYILDDLIAEADPKSFQCITDGYSKDKKHVFFGTQLIKEADPKTFSVLKYGYSKDKNNVYYDYYSGKKIEGADALSFEVLDLGIVKDKNFVYTLNSVWKIKKTQADAKTFKYYKNGYSTDKAYLYSIEVQRLARLDTFNLKEFLNE